MSDELNALASRASEQIKGDNAEKVLTSLLRHYLDDVDDNEPIEADDAEESLDLERGEIVNGLKRLGELGLGNYKIGRRDHSTRLEWTFHSPTMLVRRILEILGGDAPDTSLKMFRHTYRVRQDLQIEFELPVDLSQKEADRLAKFIESLPFE